MGREDVRVPGGDGASEAGRGAGLTKVCPCCGQRLFADMDVCYGCLYDFRRRSGGGGSGGVALGQPPRAVARPEGAFPSEWAAAMGTSREEPAGWSAGAGGFPAGPSDGLDVEGRGDSPDNPLEGPWDAAPEEPWDAGLPPAPHDEDGWRPCEPSCAAAPPTGRPPTRFGLRVETGDATVVVPLGEDGLVVGRGESCDVVLHSPSVSRRHVRVVPADAGAVVQDLGSTNPVRLGGRLVTDVARLLPGEGFELCGARVSLVRLR